MYGLSSLLPFVPAGLALYGLWSLFTLLRNRSIAMGLGVPVVISPISPMNRSWMVVQKLLGKTLTAKLPFNWYMLQYHPHGGNYDEKLKMHMDLGKVFIHVTPRGNELHVADAAASDSILARRKEFLKPIKLLEVVDLFGRSLASVEGADWQRHRRITAPPFNERNSNLVWLESIRQADQMLDFWNEANETGVNSVTDDTMTLGLHVLTCAGFGQTYSFRSASQEARDGYVLNYRDCLACVLENLILFLLIPTVIFNSPFAPKKFKQSKFAVEEYKRYIVEMVQNEKVRIRKGEVAANLLSVMVKHSEEALANEKLSNGKGLSDDEIYGNIFIFSLAGHESTANTLAFAIYLFAAFPEWQEWVAEEVHRVFADLKDTDTPNYEEMFPRLPRCLAAMYETLRLYGPILSVPKCTGVEPAQVVVDGRQVTVPPNTKVHLNVAGVHMLPDYWGTDNLVWNPSRWIEVSGSKPNSDSIETVTTPIKGSFLPWADGPRACPGKKFAMVEFVAVISALLRTHRVGIVPAEGESAELAQKRVQAVIKNCRTKLTLQMRNPKSVRVRWVKRDGI